MSKANQFHCKPPGHKGKPCPICGCPGRYSGEHRLAPDTARTVYVKLVKSDRGWVEKEIGRPRVRTVQRAPGKIEPKTIEQIAKATAMIADGKQVAETAKALGVTTSTLRECRQRHTELWDKALDRAMQAQAELVRIQAGTNAVLDNPAEFLAKALVVDRWATKKDIELFPKTGATTLTTFYESYFLPVCLSENKPTTNYNYGFAVQRWRLLTGDPPLAEITNATMATFREACKKLTTHRGTRRIATGHVRNILRWIQAILDKAGPPSRRNRDAAGILTVAPYAKPPRAVEKEPKIVRVDVLEQVLLATAGMDVPRFDGIKPPAWWRALLLTAFYTGLRRGTLFSLLMTDMSWNDRLLVIPGKRIKTGRPHTVPLHDACYEALLAIRTDREKVFPWPFDLTWFINRFHYLQTMAGLKRADHFGLHGLRRTHCTLLWEGSPAAAQLSLGHRQGSSVTAKHYVGKDGIVSRAIAALPTLGAFKGNSGKEGAA